MNSKNLMEQNSWAFNFVKDLGDFSWKMYGLDRVWNVLFPDQKEKWHHLHVTKYQNTFYINHLNIDDQSLEVEPEKAVRSMNAMGRPSTGCFGDPDQLKEMWEPLFQDARRWMKLIKKDWIKANKRIQVDYPLRYRYGIAPHALVRASLSDIYRLDVELGRSQTREFIHLVENGFFMKRENTEVSSMAANDYFAYCRIAYIAGNRDEDHVDESLSGREMYRRYADGRHEGLLDIDPASKQAFTDWVDGTHPKRTHGGHPWEIKRGGNTTHIDLSVYRPSTYPKEGFKVELRGESIGRMVETVRMFLAIHEAGLPISIANPENVRKRLLAQDNIGIVPSYIPFHRAWQHFGRQDDVFDVMHYNDLGRFKRRITPFITWEPLPILKPADL